MRQDNISSMPDLSPIEDEMTDWLIDAIAANGGVLGAFVVSEMCNRYGSDKAFGILRYFFNANEGFFGTTCDLEKYFSKEQVSELQEILKRDIRERVCSFDYEFDPNKKRYFEKDASLDSYSVERILDSGDYEKTFFFINALEKNGGKLNGGIVSSLCNECDLKSAYAILMSYFKTGRLFFGTLCELERCFSGKNLSELLKIWNLNVRERMQEFNYERRKNSNRLCS